MDMEWPRSAKPSTKRLVLVIPFSLTSDTPHLREKTYKIGMIGRAASIFRVDEIVLFPDLAVDQTREAKIIRTILSYMEAPQYLRRKLFRITRELRYAGILPPLRTPHHPISSSAEGLRLGQFREGVIDRVTKEGLVVDAGVGRSVLVRGIGHLLERVTVKITDVGDRIRGVLVNRGDVPFYWGYDVSVSRLPLGRLVREEMRDLLVISTSRHGEAMADLVDDMAKALETTRGAAVLFGSPREGLSEILSREGIELGDISEFVVNVVPEQGTKTVRTEEAVYAFLAIFNAFIRSN